MTRIIETNPDGTMKAEQSAEFMLASAQIVKEVFAILAETTAEEMLDIQNKLTQSEFMLQVVNKAFSSVVAADLPASFNNALMYKALSVVQTMFEQIYDKIALNEKLVLEKNVGIAYNDISPKDVIDYLTKDEVK